MNQSQSLANGPSLYVDLDGTLIFTDLLHESAFALFKRNPLCVFAMFLWLIRGGRAHLKAAIARRILLDVVNLPWNAELIDFLHDQKRRGRRLVLATASDHRLAEQVAKHIDLFDAVMASDGKCNLGGKRKLSAIQQDSELQGYDGAFDYVGNAKVDLPLWAAARQAYMAAASRNVRHRAELQGNVTKEFNPELNTMTHRLSACLKAMRLHQWLKNFLVFLPMLASHQWGQVETVWASLLAFLAFGFVASSGYWVNDLLDLESDRQHPQKYKRPFASGDLPVFWGVVGVPVLLGIAVLIALGLPLIFLAVLGVYYLFTLSYSLWLKRIVMLDVTVLALLYTSRILGGAAATGIAPSFWLLAFSVFLFLGLAILKRYTEFNALSQRGGESAPGRGYRASDLNLIGMLGTNSGFISVLVLALYINSSAVLEIYSWPEIIWLVCPLMIYWHGRMWFKAHRGQMHHDPVVFAARDPVSWLVVILGALIFFVAR